MNRNHRDGPSGPDSKKNASSDSKVAPASPPQGTTTGSSGYPEKHGPRFDPDGWGEANAARSDRAGTAGPGSQGHAAGERSFDHGPDDKAPDQDATDADLTEPGERGAADARSPANEKTKPGSPDDDAPDPSPKPLSRDGSQRDYGQGGGQGYVHSGKPGAPDPKGE